MGLGFGDGEKEKQFLRRTYEAFQMVCINTSDCGDFSFVVGLLSGCRSNQNIRDDSCRICVDTPLLKSFPK